MKKNHLYLLFLALTAIALISRLIPHWANFAPLGALALFSGAFFPNKKWAWLPFFVAMGLSNLFIGLKGGDGIYSTLPFVYGCYALMMIMGFSLRNRRPVWKVGGVAILGSVLFFLITNFGSWAFSTTGANAPYAYPATIGGLITAYEMGIPFYRMTFVADILYTVVLFGGMAFFSRSQTSEATT